MPPDRREIQLPALDNCAEVWPTRDLRRVSGRVSAIIDEREDWSSFRQTGAEWRRGNFLFGPMDGRNHCMGTAPFED